MNTQSTDQNMKNPQTQTEKSNSRYGTLAAYYNATGRWTQRLTTARDYFGLPRLRAPRAK